MWTPYELKLYDEEMAVIKAQEEVEQGLKTMAECSYDIKDAIAWRSLSKGYGPGELTESTGLTLEELIRLDKQVDKQFYMRREGIRQAREGIAGRLLEYGLEPDVIAKITDVKLELVHSFKKNMEKR